MSLMTYTPIRIGRSDAELEIRTKKHGKESNGPSADQLDRIANPDDYYELLGPDHPTAIEWKRVLGGMLQREQSGRADKKWFLVLFPENYRLYRHVRTAENTKSSGRQDEAYLYGYPLGRQKRYRTPLEFFPHLLWLAEDKSEDYGDCTCKHCAPEWVQKIEPLPKRDVFVSVSGQSIPAKKESGSVKKEPTTAKKDPLPPKKDPNAVVPKVVVKQRPATSENPPKTQTKPAATSLPSTVRGQQPSAPPPQTGPQPLQLPALRSQDQAEDAQYRRYIFRPGEVTWFNRGAAWGLCLVVRRDMFPDPQGRQRPHYLVQPLSHPLYHPEMKMLSSEDDLRPWLAWSAPKPTHKSLAGPTHHYNNIDWRAVAEGRFGQGDGEVDASIFAARMIDDSFTLLDPLSNNTTTTGERSYNALFLGGEKIWVGEPIRLRINQGQDVMVIQQIIEKLKAGSTNINLATVHIVGDIYRLTSMPSPNPSVSAMPSIAHLPLRVREDLEFRNRVSGPKKNTVSYWKLIQPQARLNMTDVKGRWYESSILLPILHGVQNFQADILRGEIAEVGSWINGRQDANMATGKVGTRVKDRIEAFGKSVPEGLRIGQGIATGQGHEAVQPATGPQRFMEAASAPTANAPGLGMAIGGEGKAVTGVSDGDIAEFMDLDRMEDGFARDLVDASNMRL